MPNTNSKLRKALRKLNKPQSGWMDVFPAVIGKADGTVLTGVAGEIYVRNVLNGQTLTVHNAVAPNVATLQVEVGRRVEFPNLWQVKGVREAFSAPAGQGGVAYHFAQHVYPAADSGLFPRKQIRELTVLVADAANFVVQVYGGQVRMAGGMALIKSQQIDLTLYIPAAGAVYVNIEADVDGVLTVNAGTAFGAKELATAGDIPVPVAGQRRVATVILFESMEALLDEHILVPMPLEADQAGMETGTQIDDAAADTPLDADKFGFWDVVDAALKSITWANIKATLKTYFDTLYSVIGHTHGAGYTDEEAQDAVGAMVDTTLEYVDATPLLRRAALTGVVTASAGSNDTTIAALSITNAMIANTTIDLTAKVTGILPAANGGTGIANAGTITNASNTTITGGGTLVLGGFTLTVPQSLTVAGLAVANVFTATQTITVASGTTALLALTYSTTESQARVGGIEIQAYAANNVWIASNLYFNGSAWKYRANGKAVQLYLDNNGELSVETAPSGTAGGSITKTKQLSITSTLIDFGSGTGGANWSVNSTQLRVTAATGNVGIGTIAPSQKLHLKDGQMLIERNAATYIDMLDIFVSDATGIPFFTIGKTNAADQSMVWGWNNAGQYGGFWVWGQNAPLGLWLTKDSNVGVGTEVPSIRFHVVGQTTTTNAVLETQRIESKVSTAATGGAAGFGVGLSLYAETATDGTNKQQGRLWSKWIVATNGSETSAVGLDAYTNSTAQEFISGQGDAGGVKLALYGGTRVARAAAMTAADAGAINSGDAGTDAVIANLRTRVNELAAMLNATTGINVCA
jgi:hypothetical protein